MHAAPEINPLVQALCAFAHTAPSTLSHLWSNRQTKKRTYCFTDAHFPLTLSPVCVCVYVRVRVCTQKSHTDTDKQECK